ncbi:MAG: AMIN domain-containing protein [Desulfobacterales bacterium]|nr:AMIN domain-containing protein [Desulfobacterales bacterium]
MDFSLAASKTPQQIDAAKLRSFWEHVSPDTTHSAKSVSLQSDNFNLTLDPSRYPQLSAFDGGRIILDINGTLPPLLQSLIQDKSPYVRIVNGANRGAGAVLGDILRSAGFYSLEEQTLLEFGSDPKVTLRVDFKVERTADSVVRNELLLVNADTWSMPHSMTDFLKKRGITLA